MRSKVTTDARAGWLVALLCGALGCGGATQDDAAKDAANSGDATEASTGEAGGNDPAADAGRGPDGGQDAPVGSDADMDTSSPAHPDTGVDAPEAGEAGGGPCQREADCPPGFDCGYALADGCSAKGTCVPKAEPPYNGSLTEICACDGVLTDVGSNFPSGYAPLPATFTGACAPADGARGFWGDGCGMSADCLAGLQCIDDIPSELPGYCVP